MSQSPENPCFSFYHAFLSPLPSLWTPILWYLRHKTIELLRKLSQTLS